LFSKSFLLSLYVEFENAGDLAASGALRMII